MSVFNTPASYGWMAKLLHWMLFLLIVGMLGFGFYMTGLSKEAKSVVYGWHKLTGLTILLLMLIRLVWRWLNVQPELPLDVKKWERWAERAVHYSLYFFAIAMPLAGWIGASAAGRPPKLIGMELAFPGIPLDKNLSGLMFDLHESIAFILITLITVHVAAALFHHFVKKDNILLRMMPQHRSRHS